MQMAQKHSDRQFKEPDSMDFAALLTGVQVWQTISVLKKHAT